MLLSQISPNDPVSALALAGMLGDGLLRPASCPILFDAQFYTKSGAADSVKNAREAADKTLITRALNANNTATPPTPTYSPVTKRIVSFDASSDVLLEDRNEDPEAELALQSRLEAYKAGFVLQEMFFEGDNGVTPTDFDGMRNIVDASYVYEDGLLVPVGGDAQLEAMQLALEKFRQTAAIIQGGASHVYMNEWLKIRWISLAKRLGYYDRIQAFDQNIDTIGGIIVRGAGYNVDGEPLLPFDETVDGTANCSSMFFCRWGERVDLTVLTSVGMKGRYAGQIGNQILNNFNMDACLHLQNTTALVQSAGWRL